MLINNLDNFQIPEFTIIGAGPASITLALSLEKKGKKVLIIEAGGFNYSDLSQDHYDGSVEGENYYNLKYSRLRFFGGSSNHWGGNCRNLSEYDLRNWPIKKQELDNFFQQTCNILNIKKNFYEDKSVFKNFNKVNFLKSNINFNSEYKKKIIESKNIFLLLNSPVIKLRNINENNNSIESIYVNISKQIKKIFVNKLILGCGGIENSRILLYSKINSKNSFLNDLPIGNYWSDHPGGSAAQFVIENDKYRNHLTKDYFAPSSDFLLKNSINNLRFRINIYKKKNSKNLKKKIKNFFCLAPNLSKKIFSKIHDDLNFYCFGDISFHLEQKPIFENRIELSRELDINGINKPKIYWNVYDDVFNSIKTTLHDIAKESILKNIGRVGIDQYIYDKSYKNLQFPIGNYHHIGGTVMGNDSRTSVVDKNLRVHRSNNLFIIGSSVFSTAGYANPTFTIVQLSLRLADYLTRV